MNYIYTRFPALAHRNFRLLWLGQLISAAGSQMQVVAINWQIYLLTNSALVLGFVGLFRLVPTVIFSLFGGVVADMHDRRKIMLVTQTVMMLIAVVLGLLTLGHVDNEWLVLALTGLSAAAGAFDSPARQSLVPNLVPREDLTNALSLNSMMIESATIIGPAIAGLVIAWGGVGPIYWLNALSFLAVIAGLLLMKLEEQPHRGVTQLNLTALNDGLRFVRHNRMILATMMLDFFATFFSSATALLPIFAREILKVGPEGMGLLYSAESVGALVAGARVSMMRDLRPKGLILLGAVAVYGAATVAYGFSTWYLLSAFFLAIVGAGDAVSTILRQTIRQTETPDHLRGRMTAVNMIFFMGGPQLGNFEAGLVAAWFGAPFAVVSGGVGTIAAVALVAWLYPRLRNYVG